MDCSMPGFPVLQYLPGFAQLMSAESVMLSNVVHCRREWQITSVFLPPEPHEQYERAKMQGLRKQTDRRRQAEVFWGVLRITALGEGRRWELREKLGRDAVEGTRAGWTGTPLTHPGTAAPREGAWLWEGAPTGENWGDRAQPVEQSLLPSTR